MTTEKKESKAIFYNIYNGGGNRREKIAKFIRTKKYSFAAFSELNKFSKKSFEEWASHELELNYSEFLETPYGFHLGIASRYEMQLLKADVNYPMHHGYLLVWIEQLDLIRSSYAFMPRYCTSEIRRDEKTHRHINIAQCNYESANVSWRLEHIKSSGQFFK